MTDYTTVSRAYDDNPDPKLEADIMRAVSMLRTLAETELPGTYSSDGLLTAACALVGRPPMTYKPREVLP